MKLRDFLKVKDYSGKENDFILGRFILVGSYSGKKRYDSGKDDKKALSKYLDREVEQLKSRIETISYNYGLAQSAIESVIAIFIPDYDIAMKEEKAKHKEK